MSEYVRMLKYLRAPFWDMTLYRQTEYQWLPKDDFPLELIVNDCRTPKRPELSIFKLDDNRANLDRILAAYSVIRRENEGIGYIIFDDNIPGNCQITISSDKGTTADPMVNDLHRNLKALTNLRTAKLVNSVVMTGTVGSLSDEDLKDLVIDVHNRGYLTLRSRIGSYWKAILRP